MSCIVIDENIVEMLNDFGDGGDDDEVNDLNVAAEEDIESSGSSSSDSEGNEDDNVPLSHLAGWHKKSFNSKPVPHDAARPEGYI